MSLALTEVTFAVWPPPNEQKKTKEMINHLKGGPPATFWAPLPFCSVKKEINICVWCV